MLKICSFVSQGQARFAHCLRQTLTADRKFLPVQHTVTPLKRAFARYFDYFLSLPL